MRHRIASMLRKLTGHIAADPRWFHVRRRTDEPAWHTNYNTGVPCNCKASTPARTRTPTDEGDPR